MVDFVIGIHHLQTIKVYPLSVADQFKFADIIDVAVREIVKVYSDVTTEDGDINTDAIQKVIPKVITLIEANLEEILTLAIDMKTVELPKPNLAQMLLRTKPSLLSLLSNDQIIGLIELIYDMNYGSNSKNVASLFGKIKGMVSERQLPSSVKSTDTN